MAERLLDMYLRDGLTAKAMTASHDEQKDLEERYGIRSHNKWGVNLLDVDDVGQALEPH